MEIFNVSLLLLFTRIDCTLLWPGSTNGPVLICNFSPGGRTFAWTTDLYLSFKPTGRFHGTCFSIGSIFLKDSHRLSTEVIFCAVISQLAIISSCSFVKGFLNQLQNNDKSTYPSTYPRHSLKQFFFKKKKNFYTCIWPPELNSYQMWAHRRDDSDYTYPQVNNLLQLVDAMSLG